MRFLTDLFIKRCFYWTDASNGLFGCYEFSRAGSTFKARKKGPATQLDTTTIAEAHRSLSLRGTSGERAGERGSFHGIGAANWNPLSLTLSPLLRRGEGEPTRRTVIVPRLAPEEPTLPPAGTFLNLSFAVRWARPWWRMIC